MIVLEMKELSSWLRWHQGERLLFLSAPLLLSSWTRFFEEVFVSQEIGYNKPAKAYFDACFARIPGFDPKKAILVGDSLTSDILGGINAGVATVWVNPAHLPARPDIQPDYEIEYLHQLQDLLDTM